MRSVSAPSKRTVTTLFHFPGCTKGLFAAIALAAVGCAMVSERCLADSATTQPAPQKTYWISYFAITFPAKVDSSATLQAQWTEIIGDTEVDLSQTKGIYVAPTPDAPITHPRIADLNVAGSAQYTQGAILAIDKAIVRRLDAEGYGAVLAVPSPYDIDPQDQSDLRLHKSGTLHLYISVPTAAEVRTVATGARFGSSKDRINNSKYDRIVNNSPVQAISAPSDQASPFFDQAVVNDYVDRLNRQPGRRVDVALSAADAPDQYVLDYLVNEMKPWYVYAQASNTGPIDTPAWRERLGFVDNQLTNNDDILSVDAVTDFDHTTTVTGSYEFPLDPDDPDLGTDRLRGRVYGMWDQYVAADLGFPGDTFSGSDFSGGAEVIFNIYQDHTLFVDAIGGARFQQSQVKSAFEMTNVTADYTVPYVGVRADDNKLTYNYSLALNVEGAITGDSKSTLAQMGKANPDPNFVLAQPDLVGSFYLEPLIDPGDFAAGQSTLAHEIYGSFRGQWAFNYRVIPQFEQTAGGFYTVRGYPEAATAGDNVFLGTLEYRFHLARALGVAPNPTKFTVFGDPFRLLPQQPYQRPDWDCILRAFVDAGEVFQSSIVPGESNSTLLSVGVGAELQVYQNIDVRGDWGMALTNLTNVAKTGSNRFTVVVTLLY